jgi:hypothetical protein
MEESLQPTRLLAWVVASLIAVMPVMKKTKAEVVIVPFGGGLDVKCKLFRCLNDTPSLLFYLVALLVGC